jgi:hypothetical protein
METALTPKNSNQKSFYNKAKVVTQDGTTKLISYETVVAELKDNKLKLNGYYSMTTARHVREFATQNGFGKITKQMMELGSVVTK